MDADLALIVGHLAGALVAGGIIGSYLSPYVRKVLAVLQLKGLRASAR